jgi:predicted nucleotide-binding protein (sugar kinase/HSP70/actin superfamily)
MIENIIRKSKEFSKPLLSLTIDEHTGEAGFITRLEAFIDMLYRKKRSTIINKLEVADYDYAPQTNICDFIKTNG